LKGEGETPIACHGRVDQHREEGEVCRRAGGSQLFGSRCAEDGPDLGNCDRLALGEKLTLDLKCFGDVPAAGV
jgi:hypothetical protein